MESKRPLVSVIVPVYNAESTLARCIDSILGQSYTGFELLLVDDGSRDRSGSICDAYAARDNRVRVIHQPNGGVSSARNNGLDHAIGSYVTFVDSDDYVTENLLSAFIEYADYDLVVGGYRSFPGKNCAFPRNESYHDEDMRSFIENHLTQFYFISPQGKLYNRSIIEEKRIRFDRRLRFSEDYLFNLNYLYHCRSLKTIPVCNNYFCSGSCYADEKYKLSYEELVVVIDCLRTAYDRLRERFALPPGYTHLLIDVQVSCYPLKNIYSQLNDDEYYHLYEQTMSDACREKFYSDTLCSPIYRTIYTIKLAYQNHRYKYGRELMHQLNAMYGHRIVPHPHPHLLTRMVYRMVTHRLYLLTDVMLRLYSSIKR